MNFITKWYVKRLTNYEINYMRKHNPGLYQQLFGPLYT